MNTTEITLRLKLEPEWYKVASALSTVLGFETFEDYVAECIETNVQMFLAGGDDIDENFRDHFKHLVYEPGEMLGKEDKSEKLAPN